MVGRQGTGDFAVRVNVAICVGRISFIAGPCPGPCTAGNNTRDQL